MKEGTVYPPHLGYSEFTTSTSSLGFETETFSELFFSSSSEDDDPDDVMVGPETSGILYKISRQLDKVPKYLGKKKHWEDESAEERVELVVEENEHYAEYDPVQDLERIHDEISFLRKRVGGKPEEGGWKKEEPGGEWEEEDPVKALDMIQEQISHLIERVEEQERVHQRGEVRVSISRRLGSSTVDIRGIAHPQLYRSLPSFPPMSPASSIEYISPKPGVGYVNSGYCIWASEELLAQGAILRSTSKDDEILKQHAVEAKEDIIKPDFPKEKLEEGGRVSGISVAEVHEVKFQDDRLSDIDPKVTGSSRVVSTYENIQSGEDVDRIIKEMESRLIKDITSGVSIVTDLAEDSPVEEEEEVAYYTPAPVERRSPRNVKFRFDSGDYRDDEESDKEMEEKGSAKVGRIEKKFERMASETKDSELEKSDGEFQKMVSQMSVEEMDEALKLWDKGGMSPSDSKSLTEPSNEASPQEGALEEDKQQPPPIPSPRAVPPPLEQASDYAEKKSFWEQMSSSSSEEKPPVPKPRLSISGSLPFHSDSLQEDEIKSGTRNDIDLSLPKGESVDSEIEYIEAHKDELSYDNEAFYDEAGDIARLPDKVRTKRIYERSVSLPCDPPSDPSTNSVRTKKRIFEAQIKKEMVVEHLMSQLEEEASPEHKSIKHKNKEPIADTQTIVTRQIHTDIFSDELEQQIDSLVPENKELRQPKEIEKLEGAFLETSSPETSISTSAAEVLQYKNDLIAKPSDSLEVHIDKSELEETEKEKELEDDIKEMEDTRLQMPGSKEKVGSITSSQGESEDTMSESDVTPEDSRFKQDIQEWQAQDSRTDKAEKKARSVYTPEEHLPDTVWEVPVQEISGTLPVETVQQIPSQLALKHQKKQSSELTESEATEIAKKIVEGIEVEIGKREATLFGKPNERDNTVLEGRQILESLGHKFRRTDTTTSSMEITDEDLRSSGVDSDISPLESQACFEDRSDDELSVGMDFEPDKKGAFGEDVLEKTLAEVKESLEAVKEELIEEKKKKKDSITKESPSEFEFKNLTLENKMEDSITESNLEEGAFTVETEKPLESYISSYSERDVHKHSESQEVKTEIALKLGKSVEVMKQREEELKTESETSEKEIAVAQYKKENVGGSLLSDSHRVSSSQAEEISYSHSQISDEVKVITKESSTLEKDSTLESKEIHDFSESSKSDTTQEMSKENISIRKTEVKEDDKMMKEESQKVMDTHLTEFKTEGGTAVKKIVEKMETSSVTKIESKQHVESYEIKGTHCQAKLSDQEQRTDDEDDRSMPKDEEVRDFSSDYCKSPGPDEAQEDTSSSSDAKMGFDTPPKSGDKPKIVVRKHSRTVSKIQGELSDPYSSSGESQFHSFEQTSESLRSPPSRPLSSDLEGVAINLAGVTGSSEYESAISGQSTTATSRDFHTAVGSLSSRGSMRSLDSESSGNLASMEVSSEASETLVPSAMELEEVEAQTPLPEQKVEMPTRGALSFSESNGQSVSFDVSTEDMSEEEADLHHTDGAQKMKRSHEMTFQPEPRPIVEEKLSSSVDDLGSVISDSTGQKTIIELSRTESDKMDASATSDQLTVSGTSEQLSLSESKDTESTIDMKKETVSTQLSQELGEISSVTITTTSVVEQGVQSVCTQVTSKTSHSNGPTQVEYSLEYDEGEVKKRPGHRRNGSTSFRPSMIPVLQKREPEKKKDDIMEDSAESDKYSQTLTSKEGSQEEKKDIDEAEKLEEEFYQTEADQGFHRDIREGRIFKEAYEYEETKDYETKSRLSSVAFSEDRPDSELSELLKQCSSDGGMEDPIERPQTPEPVEECEIKDDTPEFSSEAQASVTELEMEYSGAFSRSSEYEAHISPIREKGTRWQHDSDMAEAEAVFSQTTSIIRVSPETTLGEKHELETQELVMKDEHIGRASPVPGITITQHMTPFLDDSFILPDVEERPHHKTPEPVPKKVSSEMSTGKEEGISETAATASAGSHDTQGETSEKETAFKKEEPREIESASDSPTSDSFELLEKPDLADEFVIIEEVGREAEEQDREGKSVKISGKRGIPRPVTKEVVSPPSTSTKMTKIKYYTKGGAEEEVPFEFESGTPPKADQKTEESSQEGSPPSAADEDEFKPEVEAGKKWMEMQFQGEPAAPIFGYDMEYERAPLEDIKEEELADLESSSKIGSMGSQVSHSIGSFGSVKESLSSTPDYDLLAGRRFFTRSGEHDDVSMSSLQEFERLENLVALESTKHSRSTGSQDSLTSSSNSKKHGSRSGGDDISLSSLKEFEGLEKACIAAERIEKKAKAEEESLLSEIEEGHESQASESESCATVSESGLNKESDEEDYEKRMFEIDEIIRQAQTNVEQFLDSKYKEDTEKKLKSDSLGRADSLEEMTKVPELDLDQPSSTSRPYCGKTYITQWEDLSESLMTDSLELRTQISKISAADPFTTSTDSLDVRVSHDIMSVSTDSVETGSKRKTVMTDSIEIGDKSCMITSSDSLEEKVTDGYSLEEDQGNDGRMGEVAWEGSINRMPPPRAEFALGSTDSLEPSSSTATHATYHCDSAMSSSITSGDSTTMVDDEAIETRTSVWFDDGKPYVTELIEPGDDEFAHVIRRTVEMPPQITKVSFKGEDAERALREYIEKFDPGEDVSETREVDEAGNVHVKRVVQKRVILRPEEMGGGTTKLEGEELEKYVHSLTSSHSGSSPSSFTTSSSQSTVIDTKGESIKSDKETTEVIESQQKGGRPSLRYDISLDEEPEFDPMEHDWRFGLHTHLEREEDHLIDDHGKSAKVALQSEEKKK